MVLTTALIVTTYNRPEYLKRCLESLQQLSEGPNLLIFVDDASTDKTVVPMAIEATIHCENLHFSMGFLNQGIKAALKCGIEEAIHQKADLIINLDSDAIVKPHFITELKRLHAEHPGHIISGFNSANTNKDGSLRNPVIESHVDYSLKKHANGINMCFTPQQYYDIILPALEAQGNWDFNTAAQNRPFVIAKPSLVQHIGMKSSMGHNDDPDVACDFYELELPDVTLIGVDNHRPADLKRAADICTRSVLFGAVKMITDAAFTGKEGYSRFCIESMAQHVETSHALVIQGDGYIQNPLAWNNDWLQYDYIGATWWYKDGKNNGNGGFSLRSKKLLDILATLELKEFHPEDHVICRQLRPWLEKEYDIKFAPEEVCNRFSIEAYNSPDNVYSGQFGFHGRHVTGLPHPLPALNNFTPPANIRNPRQWRR